MKRVLTLVLAVCLVMSCFALSACSSTKYEIAMITDKGTIDDKSFNQGTWEGVQAYAEANDISC